MSKIVDFEGRKKLKADLHKAEKLEGLQSLLRCSHCSMRCAKCGVHGEEAVSVRHAQSRITFRLCPVCADEYKDLAAYLDNDQESNLPYWYNRQWVRQWLSWLDYQNALADYASSPEVLEVIAELRKG